MRWLGCKSPLAIQLVVAGNFVNDDEKDEFDRIVDAPETRGQVRYLGFVSNEVKRSALLHADFFCFPTYYQNENQPVNLIEAMAFGLPILTTRWRSLPELLPPGYRFLVDIRSPDQIGRRSLLASVAESPADESFREMFLRHFTIDQHLAALAGAFHSIEPADASPAPRLRQWSLRTAADRQTVLHPVNFSIITPSFRNSNWLKLCIASVADQQGVTFEHIVQDSCSDDGTRDWLPQDRRVKAFIEKDQGMYDAVNRGFKRAQGDIVAYLNCDEQYLPGAP